MGQIGFVFRTRLFSFRCPLLLFTFQPRFRLLYSFTISCEVAAHKSILYFGVASNNSILDVSITADYGVLDFCKRVNRFFGNFFLCLFYF